MGNKTKQEGSEMNKVFILRRRKLEDIQFIVYMSWLKECTYWSIDLRCKGQQINLTAGHRCSVLKDRDVLDMAEMYLKTQGFNRNKFTWIERNKYEAK